MYERSYTSHSGRDKTLHLHFQQYLSIIQGRLLDKSKILPPEGMPTPQTSTQPEVQCKKRAESRASRCGCYPGSWLNFALC